jgi:signal transduction histidine kinase
MQIACGLVLLSAGLFGSFHMQIRENIRHADLAGLSFRFGSGHKALMNTQAQVQDHLAALAVHLHARREAVLEAWREAVDNDPDLTTGSALSRTLFNDHIPDILDAFVRRLQAWPDAISMQVQQQENIGMTAHGLHRWQQGFRLRELTREWGYLQLCLVDEVESYATAHPELESTVIATALRLLTHLCVAGVSDSTEQYWKLQQAAAAGHLRDLEHALDAVKEIENARATGWHQAAHDLRGGLSTITVASWILNEKDVPEKDRLQTASMLQKSVSTLHVMLENLIDLARLEAGQEQRTVAPFDAAELLSDFCASMQPLAKAHGLFLKSEGPLSLPVSGDQAKVLRIVQNLVLNALKYTEKGGLVIRWEASRESDAARWMVSVQDTGPGFHNDPGVPMADQLREATKDAHQIEENASASGTSSSHDEPALTLVSQSAPTPLRQQAGEGIGLSIVKGLCDLLDATLELETSSGQGSTFRVTFPNSYRH